MRGFEPREGSLAEFKQTMIALQKLFVVFVESSWRKSNVVSPEEKSSNLYKMSIALV
jgi:hypothetical protein